MGYESRIFIVNRSEVDDFYSENPIIYAEKIADMKLGRMYNGFIELFKNPIDYTLYIDNENKDTDIDKYGKHLKYTTISEIITYLENLTDSEEYKNNPYRRIKPFYNLIKGFDENEWNELQIVHFGY